RRFVVDPRRLAVAGGLLRHPPGRDGSDRDQRAGAAGAGRLHLAVHRPLGRRGGPAGPAAGEGHARRQGPVIPPHPTKRGHTMRLTIAMALTGLAVLATAGEAAAFGRGGFARGGAAVGPRGAVAGGARGGYSAGPYGARAGGAQHHSYVGPRG